jgi:hypothetical protein
MTCVQLVCAIVRSFVSSDNFTIGLPVSGKGAWVHRRSNEQAKCGPRAQGKMRQQANLILSPRDTRMGSPEVERRAIGSPRS